MRLPRSLALLLTAGLLAIGQPAALAADGANGLLQGEVFLDDPELDPGTGTPLVLSGDATDALRIGAGELDLTGVEPGSHTLYLRFQDQAGRWSAPLGQSFYVTEGNPGTPLPGGQNQVVAAEAFVDLDPGEGNAVPLATAADGAIDSAAEILSGTVPLTGVGIGVHVLNTRTLDSTGLWSPPTRQTFFVPALADGGGNPVILIAAEGIIDGGPAIALPADDGDFDSGIETVTLTEAVSDDYHSAVIRFQDSQGLWSDSTTTACSGTGVLSGFLIDATTGRPMVGVTIRVGGLTSVTDATGFYAITGLACGTHEVVVSVGGFLTYTRTFSWFSGGWFNIRLTKESTASGITDYTAIYGDPVNTATGNYVYQRRDLEIPGIGLTLEFDRAYNSREASGGSASATPLGYGWRHSYQVSLAVDAGDVTITWGDGSTETYAPDGAGGYTPQYGVFDTLTDDGDGTFTLTKRDRTAYQFDTSGRLAAIVDKNGNTVSLFYTGAYLTEIRDTAERSVTLAYDGSGRINLITDPLGRTVAYAYDTNGDLISATDTNGNLTQYAYDGSHQILTVVDPRGNTVVTNTYDADRRVVSYQTDAKGNGTTYVYQELDRITTITDALGGITVRHHDELLRLIKEVDARGGVALYTYDTLGNRIAVSDKNGNLTQYAYDTRGNVTRKTDALGQVTRITYDEQDNPLTRTDALGNITRFEYDANGNLIRTTDALGQVAEISYLPSGLPDNVKDPRNNVTTNGYDAEGNLIQVTDALGKVTAYTYDAVGRRLTVTDALGRITVYAYDANDNLESVTDALGGVITHTYDGNDNKTATTDRNGNTTQWTYDEKDLLIGEADAAGKTESTTYDALDRRDSRTDRRGFVTHYTYDAVGNLIEVTDALGNKTTYTYDLNGNRLTQTDALGNTTRYQYDALNRQTQVTDALGNAVRTTYDALGRVVTLTAPDDRVTQNTYDALGRLAQVTDPAGGITRCGYDANGNRTSVTDPNGKLTQYGYDALNRLTQVTNALGQITTMTYDAVGNRKRVTDALGHFTTYSYSKLNLLVKETDALGNANSTSYDPGGRITAVTDANGRVTRFAYDVLDRLIRVTDAAKGLVRYGYDATGNRLSITDPNGHITRYAYDALGRRIRMTEPEGNITLYAYNATGDLIRLTKPDGVVIKYLYDALHRLKRTVYPDATSASFSYDANSNRIRLVDSLGTQIYAYDKLDRMTSHTDPFGNRVQYRYDANGNRTRLIYPDGKAAIYTYDALNRQIRATDWLGQITRYVYDAAGRMTKAINANGTTATYGYDDANRLTSLSNQTSGGSVLNAYAYTLDPVGNHASEARTEPLTPVLPTEVVTDTHDKENRLTASNGVPNSFDANGNLTAKGTDTYAYDFDNRLVQTTIGGVLTQYRYDALGNRYARIRNGVETRFVLDTNTALTNVIAETDAAGNPQSYNVYGQGLIARILGDGNVRQYHYDSRGSTIAITDSAQNTVRQYAYDPFGRVINTSGTVANPFGFLGRHGVIDEGDDLSFIRARYYDTEQQRFLAKDVKRGRDWQSQTWNRYVYSLSNPIRFVDVSGFHAKEVVSSLVPLAEPSNVPRLIRALLSRVNPFSAAIAYAHQGSGPFDTTTAESTPQVIIRDKTTRPSREPRQYGPYDVAESTPQMLPAPPPDNVSNKLGRFTAIVAIRLIDLGMALVPNPKNPATEPGTFDYIPPPSDETRQGGFLDGFFGTFRDVQDGARDNGGLWEIVCPGCPPGVGA